MKDSIVGFFKAALNRVGFGGSGYLVRSWRALLFGVLVCAYIGLSVIAYTDHGGPPSSQPLTSRERSGLEVWRKNNCQVCHQIYGFGGFLGPDLTNAVDDGRDDEDFAKILTVGYKKMPALDLSDEDRIAVLAFLRAVNRTGRSQPRANAAKRPVNPKFHWEALTEMAEDRNLSDEVNRGCEIVTSASCGSCHVPFMQGLQHSPDLTAAAMDRSVRNIGPVLKDGRGAMPSFQFSDEEISRISAFLEWVAKNRSELVKKNDQMLDREGFSWRDLQWWEYK